MDDTSIADEYEAALIEQLVDTNKSKIAMLTMLAEDRKDSAPVVAQAVERYLHRSPPDIKLCALYLIDSIVKNLREPYLDLFKENIVNIFNEVFRVGDERLRSQLFKLRLSWEDIFADQILYLIDISSKRTDPNWPNIKVRPPAIHVNPRYFNLPPPNEDPTRSSSNDTKEGRRSDDRSQNDHQPSYIPRTKKDESRRDSDSERRHDPRLIKDDKRKGSSRNSSHSNRSKNSNAKDSKRSSHESRHHRKRSSSSPSSSPKSDSSLDHMIPSLEPSLAEKEAAAIFSGDTDLRLLEPHPKKRKESYEPQNDALPLEDVDLRIRPSNGVSDPGQTNGNHLVQAGSSPIDDEDDKAAQWAKIKGTTLSHLAAANEVIARPLPAVSSVLQQPLTLQSEPYYTDNRNGSMPPNQGLPDATGSQMNKKTVRISDPAPDYGRIKLDGRMRQVRFVDGVAIAIMEESPPNFVRARQIMFRGGTKRIVINDNLDVLAAFDGREHDFTLNGNRHRIRFGAPLRELYIDGIPYSCQFNGLPIYIRSREDVFSVTLFEPCPKVNDKMEATPELLAKLGYKPMPANSLPQGPYVGGPFTTNGNGPGHLAPPPTAAPAAGGWLRYQEELRHPPGAIPPGIFALPPNMGPMPPPHGHPSYGGPTRLFCPPPPSPHHHLGPPFVAYNHPPPMIPPNMAMGAGPVVVPQIAPNTVVPVMTAPNPTPAEPQNVNVSDLLSQLYRTGLLGAGEKTDSVDPQKEKEEVNKLSFKAPDTLKKRYKVVISALHEGSQCSTCGQRFKCDRNETSEKYSAHLDWHFRTSRKEREGMKKATSRKWFYEVSDWIQFEEVEDVDDRARSYFEIQEAQRDTTKQDEEVVVHQEVPTVSAKTVAQGDNTCLSCHEAFDLFFCEDTEEWRIRNAVLFEENLFHPNCYEDYIRPRVEIPQSIKQELDEEMSEQPTIKQEKLENGDASSAMHEEVSQPLPGLDFAPARTPEFRSVKTESSDEPDEEDGDADDNDSGSKNVDEPLTENSNANDPINDTLAMAEQSVIVEEIGEFGVPASAPTDSSADHIQDDCKSQDSVSFSADEANSQDSETKVIVQKSGGFVLKMKQDSVMNADQKTLNDSTFIEDNNNDNNDDLDEWKPPTPDPAYKVLPVVKKGTDQSGLCSIM